MKTILLLLLLLTTAELSAQEASGAGAEPVIDAKPANDMAQITDAKTQASSVEVATESAGESAETVTPSVAPGTRQPASEMPELFSARYLFQVVGSLFVVFLCLFAVIYMLRRFNRMGPSSGTALRIIGSANVGQRERVVLLEAGSEQLLLGVAPGSVRPLHVLAEPLVLDEGASNTDFAAILRAANPLGGKS